MRSDNLITLIVFIVYTIVAFLLFMASPSFLVSYIITIIGLVSCLYINGKAYEKNNSSNFNSYPITILTSSYIIIQMVISLICMALFFMLIISTIIQIIVYAIFIILAISLLNSKDYIEEVEAETEKEISFHREFSKRLTIISSSTHNNDYKNRLDELINSVRYTNPVSTSQSLLIENELFDLLGILDESIKNNDDDMVYRTIESLQDKMNEREILVRK
ncbi:MAG: hypothetical protein LUG89_04280 [Methanosphaera sp.]|nr:hypothetical protein [Methanosphaera sp.]